MDRYNTGVVGVDFTVSAEAALREAVRLVSPAGNVHVVHGVEALALSEIREVMPGGSPSAGMERLDRDILAEATSKLDAMVASVRASSSTGPTIHTEAAIGNPAEILIDSAKRHDADLLVMARNSESDPTRGAGSYAVRCARHAAMDVLLVRELHEGPYRCVMACVDFSSQSRAAAHRAAMLAEQDGASLHIVHAFRPPWEVMPFAAVPMAASGDYQIQHMDMLSSHLQLFKESLAARHPKLRIESHLDPAGSVGSTLVDAAGALNADLAVLGSHGRGRIERLLLGSTAERVIRSAACSVLTVRNELPEHHN